MTELLTAAQMRAIEAEAIESGAVTGRELMERAGRGVVDAMFAHWPELAPIPHKAAVLCGPGNNGGDGFVVARLLAGWGWDVTVFLLGDPGRLPPDAGANYRRWCGIGSVRPMADFEDFDLSGTRVVVDAIFGTGLSRPLDEDLAMVVGRVSIFGGNDGNRVVAIDMPTGFCSDSGRCLYQEPDFITRVNMRRPGAHLTVTFERPRLGHFLDRAAWVSGRLDVRSLGIRHAGDGALFNLETPVVRLTELSKGLLDKTDGGHKFDHGHALVLTGGAGRTGAARLAARGALRIGAGLVTLGVPGAAQQEVACQITALMQRRVDDAGGLTALLTDRRINALCLGPGLGLGQDRAALVGAALEGARATVLDADALTLIGRDPALFAKLHDQCVLTPHAGEFARLFPDMAERLAAPPTRGPAFSRVDAVRAAADRAGCTVLLKGPDTVIAAPGGRCSVNSAHYGRAMPWLATAGAGDVLAGFIAGLLARGLAPMRAAERAAFCHVDCALKCGPGLIAEDLPEALPAVLRDHGC